VLVALLTILLVSRLALFLGISMSVTAFPVLARILTDRGISTSPLGVVAITCAAVDDGPPGACSRS
jgi:Kef-type K+ transport system membrane component KefB